MFCVFLQSLQVNAGLVAWCYVPSIFSLPENRLPTSNDDKYRSGSSDLLNNG